MHQPSRIAQSYGYTACMIALILALFSVSSLVDAAFKRANPLQDDGLFDEGSLTSFEAFKVRRGTITSFDSEIPAVPDTASEATLRARYEALVAERIETTRYQTSKTFVIEGLLLAVSLVLFWFHWGWLRRLKNGSTLATG